MSESSPVIAAAVRRYWQGLLPLAVWCAFFVAPIIRYADPDQLAGGGLLSGAGVLGIWSAAPFRTWHDKLIGMIGLLVAAWGVAALVDVGDAVGAPARANDRRCLAIQRDMLSARPRRDDGPDLFQALGCRPQGEGSVYAPPVGRKTEPR